MFLALLAEAVLFLFAFSALPVTVVYYVKSRDTCVVPYILIQLTATVYVSVDILYTGVGWYFTAAWSHSSFLCLQILLRAAFLVLVPLFMNIMLGLKHRGLRLGLWSAIAATLVAFLAATRIRGAGPVTFSSPPYLASSGASLALAVYAVIVAIHLRNDLHGPLGINNRLFVVSGPVYVLYLVSFAVYPLLKGDMLRTGNVSFTNLCYGIWNLFFLRFLIQYIAARPITAAQTPLIETFLKSANFTEREAQILRAAIAGQSNKQIAYSLSISEGTVKAHLFNAFQKVGIHTRVELMNAVFSQGSGRPWAAAG